MNESKPKRYAQLAVLIILIALGGVAIWYWGPPSSAFFAAQDLNKERAAASGEPEAMLLLRSTQNQLVQRYVTAYQTSNCAEIARCTLWVQDRLRLINAKTDDSTTREDKRSALCGQLFSREAGMGKMSILGIDDQYLIPMTVKFSIEGADRATYEKS